MSEKRRIVRATGVIGGATLASRVTGLVRDMVVARLFGAGHATDAFFMAFTLPNLLRRFFAEGSLTAAFVPTFSEVYHRQGRDSARQMADACATALVLVLAIVTLLGILGSPLLVRLIGFGFSAVEGKLALTDQLNRLMFPYILFVSLLALVTGVLNVLGHYLLPAVSPVLLNLAMIACGFGLSGYFEVPIMALAVGVLLGGVLQLLLQLPVLLRYGFLPRPNFRFNRPEVRRVARLMLPGLVGVAIYQINVVVGRALASFLPQGSVSFLYYSQRLFEFPQGLFIVSLAQALLPALSRQAAAGNREGVRESLRYALTLTLVVTLPAALGLALCAEPMFSLFFRGGEFDAEAVRQTAAALAAYAPGLVFVGFSRVMVPTFYAMKNTRTPVWISFWTLLANLLLGLVLMQYWQHIGLALALTFASALNAILLAVALRRWFGPIGGRKLLLTALRLLPGLGAMALVTILVLHGGPWHSEGHALEKFLRLGAAVAGAVLTYLCLVACCGVEEVRDMLGAGWRRLRPR